MKNNWMKKTIIATTCCVALLSGNALVGTSFVGQAQAATATSASAKAQSIVALAKSLQGKVKYVYGTNNPSSLIFDCSSFTKYVFGKYGVSLKWGTSSQKLQGTYVSKSNLRVGDLIFFNNGKTSTVSHVGIYIGNGQFIHNTIGSKINGVYIAKLSDYSFRYSTARRVL
ncbi:cell wall-associated NlpC family hydrolase [Paenibacillus phyllosphaerae]|uniref:Cell wall-associated NlpC family hydrolase n=1 Tax=Paenibacillus phyllosphaerae TaxID=274593 RepID=A0A7W5AYY0_9BACL|nr:C40 family peptidase [Paenibacillus phyllosphaerae]MBB3110851.1 cell wall-associated NlpC family hydrolase [Paenibacillus phyllosphaerae]